MPPRPTTSEENHTASFASLADSLGTNALERRNFTGAFNRTGPFCVTCLIQDNDPRVTYTGGWQIEGTAFNTTRSTTQRGAKVTLPFTGSKIMVTGTVPVSNFTIRPPTAIYTITGRRPVELTLPMADTEIPHQSFFQATDLGRQQHTLTIEVVSAPAPYILQYFFVAPHRFTQNSTESPIGDPGPTPSTEPKNDAESPIPYQSTTPAPSTTLVTVLAGLVGCLFAIILIGGLLIFFRRKRKKAGISSTPWSFSKYWRRGGWSPSQPPESIYTPWTTSESIHRQEPSWMQRGSSAFSQSGPPSAMRASTINQKMRFSLSPMHEKRMPPVPPPPAYLKPDI